MNNLQHNVFFTCANWKFAGREYAPFLQEGWVGKGYQLFGDDLSDILVELNEALAA